MALFRMIYNWFAIPTQQLAPSNDNDNDDATRLTEFEDIKTLLMNKEVSADTKLSYIKNEYHDLWRNKTHRQQCIFVRFQLTPHHLISCNN